MNELLITLGAMLSSAATAVIGFAVAKSKYKQEVQKLRADTDTTEIENGAKVIDMYKAALDDLPARYEEKFKHVQERATTVEQLFEKKEQILLQEIEHHKKQAALYKRMYDEKVREFNKYKREHP